MPIGINDTLEPTGPGYVVVRGKDVGLDTTGFGQNLALTDVNLQLLADKVNNFQLTGLDFLRKSTIGTWTYRVVAGEPASGQFKAATASLEIVETDADGTDRSAALAGLEAGNRIAALSAHGLEAFSGVVTGNTLVAGRRTLALNATRGHIGNLTAGTRYVLAQVFADRALSMEVSNVFSAAVSGGVLQLVAVAGGIPGQATPPTDPSVGDLWIDLSITPPALRRWNGTIWATIGAASGAGIPVQATAPTNPATNDLWVNTANDPATLRRYNGTSWVVVGGAEGTAIPVQATAPANPVTNELWVDISANPALLRRYDGTAWLAVGATGSGFTIPIQSVAPDSPSLDDLWIDTSGTPAFLRRYDGAVWDDVGGVSVLSHVEIGALMYSATAGVTPGAGRFKSGSDILYLSETDADGASLVTALDALMAGGRLALRATTGHEIWSAKIDSIADSGTYRTVRISDVRGAITFAEGTRYVFHEATTFRADRIQAGPGLAMLQGSTGTAQIDLDDPLTDGVAESVDLSLNGNVLSLIIGRSGTLPDLTDTQDLAGLRNGLATDADLSTHEADVSGQGHVTATERDKLSALEADRQLPATTAGQNVGQVPKVQQDGSYALADDEQAAAGMADGVADSVDLSLSGNILSLIIGRSGALPDLTDTQDLSAISGTSELPRWHHVAAESQFASLRTAGVDRLVADRDFTITAGNTVTEPSGTQITSVLDGDLFIWNEHTTPNRWERFGNIGDGTGLSSVATDNTITGDGTSGNPLSVDYGDVARDTFAVRIAWTATSTIIESDLTGASVRVGTTGQLLSIPRSTLPNANQFVSIWIGTTDASRIRSILTGATSLLGTGRLWNSSITMAVGGVAGTLYTSASVAPDEHEGTILRVTINPEDLDAFIQHVIEERVADFAEQGYEGDLPDGLQPVEANPTGTDGDDLTRIGIRGTNYNIPTPTVDGSTSVRSRVGHLDSVTIAAGTARLIPLIEEAAAGNDYQVEITDDSTSMSVQLPRVSGEAIRAKVSLASAPTNYQNALLLSMPTTRPNSTAFTNEALNRWNLLKGTSNSQLYLVNVANSDGALTVEVWKYPRAAQGLKGDKGDQGDPGTGVTFGAAAGQVSEIAEGNNTDVWPFSKLETGETQATTPFRLGWDNQLDLGGAGVMTGTTGTALQIPVAPTGADQIWIAVRVDNASDVTQIAVGGYNQLGASGYFNTAGVQLTFNSETWFRWTTRVLDDTERTILDDRMVTVRITPDNLDEHITRLADNEVQRLRREAPVIEGLTLSNDQLQVLNSAGVRSNLAWPSALVNPAKGTATPVNTPGTPSAGTSDAWSPDDHDHGIAASGGAQNYIAPQSVSKTSATVVAVAGATNADAGTPTTIPLESLGTGSILSALDTAEDSVMCAAGVYEFDIAFADVRGTGTVNERLAVGVVVQSFDGADWGDIATSASQYGRGGSATQFFDFFKVSVKFSLASAATIRFQALTLPTFGVNAFGQPWQFAMATITAYAIGGIQGIQGDQGPSGVGTSFIPQGAVTRAKVSTKGSSTGGAIKAQLSAGRYDFPFANSADDGNASGTVLAQVSQHNTLTNLAGQSNNVYFRFSTRPTSSIDNTNLWSRIIAEQGSDVFSFTIWQNDSRYYVFRGRFVGNDMTSGVLTRSTVVIRLLSVATYNLGSTNTATFFAGALEAQFGMADAVSTAQLAAETAAREAADTALGARIDGIVAPPSSADDTLLALVASTYPRDITFTLGTRIPGGSDPGYNAGTHSLNAAGSFSETGIPTDIVALYRVTESETIGGVQLQNRLIVGIDEEAGSRRYEGEGIRWGGQLVTLTYFQRSLNNFNEYYSDVVTTLSAAGDTVALNVEDVQAEAHEAIPYRRWIWHHPIATTSEHISNDDFTAATASTTIVPTQHAVAEYVADNAPTGGGGNTLFALLTGFTAALTHNIATADIGRQLKYTGTGDVVLTLTNTDTITSWVGVVTNESAAGIVTVAPAGGSNQTINPGEIFIFRLTGTTWQATKIKEAGTNLTRTSAAGSVTIVSNTGANALIPAADSAEAGVMSAADKAKLDTYPDNADDLQVNPVDGSLLNIIAEREALDTTLNLGQHNNAGEFGIRISPTPQYGSFDPAIPSGDAGTLLQLDFVPGSSIVNNVQLQNRIVVYINEAEADRTYDNKQIRWGPVDGEVQTSNLHYLNRGFNNENRYYSDVLTHRPSVGGTTTARFNLEDVAAEELETFPGTAWVWHHTIATFDSHISNQDFTSDDASTTEAPTQRAVAAYVEANAGGIQGSRLLKTPALVSGNVTLTANSQWATDAGTPDLTLDASYGADVLWAVSPGVQGTVGNGVQFFRPADLLARADGEFNTVAATGERLAIPFVNNTTVFFLYLGKTSARKLLVASSNSANAPTPLTIWEVQAGGGASAGSIEGVRFFYMDSDTSRYHATLGSKTAVQGIAGITTPAARFYRLRWNAAAAGQETLFTTFPVTLLTSAQAEASQADEFGNEALPEANAQHLALPANHIFTLGEGLYNIEHNIRGDVNAFGRQSLLLYQVNASIDSDVQVASVIDRTSVVELPDGDDDQFEFTGRLLAEFIRVPSGGASFYMTFLIGSQTMKLTGPLKITKWRE